MIRSIYYSKFQALLRYGIMFWGADNESIPIFKLRKRVIQIMGDVGTGTSCRQLFKDYKILAVTSPYVLEVICFIKKYKSSVEQNVHVHDYNTKKMDILYMFCHVIQISLKEV
jgi:hypothetical protein